MWVAATLIDTSVRFYDRYVAPLSAAERDDYYEEQKTFAEMFRVPREQMPGTYAEFEEYFDHVVEHELADNQALRGVVQSTLGRPDLPLPAIPLRPIVTRALRLATVGELPPRLRAEAGLSWSRSDERLIGALRPAIRTAIRASPGFVRYFPRARAAERRLAA